MAARLARPLFTALAGKTCACLEIVGSSSKIYTIIYKPDNILHS